MQPLRRPPHIALVSYYAHMPVGMGTYARELLAGLAQLELPYSFSVISAQPLPETHGFRNVAVPMPLPAVTQLPLLLWDQFAAWGATRRLRPDLAHWLQPRTSLLPAAPRTVMTLGDMIPWREPAYGRAFLKGYGRSYAMMARRADQLVTFSEHARGDIVEILGIAPERVSVAHLAASWPRQDPSQQPPVTPPYVLFVGGSERRKNALALISAFARAELPASLRLVIAGRLSPPGVLHDDLEASVARLAPPLRERVVLAGHLGDEELQALYRAATVCAFPSLYEGFGLPVLEAMQYGVPVISSNTTSIPEVAGTAARLVDPTDVEALRAGLEEVVGDGMLRERLSERGRAQAQSFSWRRTAQETAAVYEQVLERARPSRRGGRARRGSAAGA